MNRPTLNPRVLSPEQAKAALFRAGEPDPGFRYPRPDVGLAPQPVVQPGGQAALDLQPRSFTTMERVFRILPEEGWFGPRVSPSRPIILEIGSFVVPDNRSFWLMDYSFSVFRPSGIDPGDFIQAEQGRFSNQLGFDVTVAGDRFSDIKYELDPHPATPNRSAFAPVVAPTSSGAGFNRSAANAYAVTAGPGSSLLPARLEVQGASGVPFTAVALEGQVVALSVVIFNRLRSPLSAVEGRCAGYLMDHQLSVQLLETLRPR